MQEFTYTNEFLNPWLLGLDILLILHFFYTYYRYCLRLGYRLDFWHFSLALGGVLPVLVNYIFAAASENKRFVGGALGGIQATIDRAFTIQVTGYICTYIGFYYYNLTRSGRNGRGVLEGVTAWTAGLFRDLVNTNELFYLHLFLTLLCGVALLVVTFQGGLGFDLRSRVFADDSLRPLFNFAFQAEGPLLLAAAWAKYIAERTKTVLIAALLILAMQLLGGARWPVIVPLGLLLSVYAVTSRRSVRLATIGIVMAALLTLALGLQILRSKFAPNEKRANPISELVYGNEYSDTRDFAWFLSKWDDDYLLGKNYLAGATSFLPRALFLKEFRERWSYTFYQATVTGLDTAKHTGFRLGRSGELYLNFGYLGVVVVGLLTGYTCRMIDDWIKQRAALGQRDIVTDLSITTIFNFFQPLFYSVSFWTAYVLAGMLLTSLLFRAVRTPARLVTAWSR